MVKEPRGTSAFCRIVDPRIYRLCDLVCLQIVQRFAQQVQLKDAFLAMARAAERPARKRAVRA